MVEAWVTGLGVGYLVGSVPVGLWIGRKVGRVDLRSIGSGRTGATNVLRRLGPKWSLLVFTLDLLKGALPVLILLLVWDSPTGEVLAGLSVIMGHIYPLFARFRGGRGATVGLAALLTLTPPAAATLVVLAVLLATTRIMSLSVLLGAVVICTTQGLLVAFGDYPDAYYGYAAAAFAIILFAHRDNIARLIAGTEPKLGWTGPTQPLSPPALSTRAGGAHP